ncbi:MAG: biotin--[acetyl-CoA-carboxylase] ligase [Candidatus Zixiibacteriota bacterium]
MNPGECEKLADNILLYIRSTKKVRRVNFLLKKFKTPAEDIISALILIESWGYKIRKSKRTKFSDIIFVSAPDSLNSTEIGYQLNTKTIGKKIYAFQSVKSTNDIASQLAENCEPEGTIVTAEKQTKGKGRFGRKWYSPLQAGIYLSIILKPKFKTELAPGISIMTALALADAINEYCPGKVQIKWPNDILISGKKTAGILTELSADRNKIKHIIVGIGINVNHKTENFPENILKTATSLRIANHKKIDRIELLKKFLINFEKEYTLYKKHQLKASHKKIIKYSSLIGTTVKLTSGKKVVIGKAVDIDKTGGLIIEKDGNRITVSSGEVTVVKD